jgi:hypothetical protein
MKSDLRLAGLVIGALALVGLVAHLHKSPTTSRPEPKSEFTVVRGKSTGTGTPTKAPSNLPAVALPESQLGLLTGTGGLDSGSYFDCWITNSGEWTVTELRFNIKAVETHGMERWNRHYLEPISIPPKTGKHVRFKVTEGGAEALAEWKIVAGRGHPPN